MAVIFVTEDCYLFLLEKLSVRRFLSRCIQCRAIFIAMSEMTVRVCLSQTLW